MQFRKFDRLWRKRTYEYIIPSKSFCSDYCSWPNPPTNTYEPYVFESDVEIMPIIDYFFSTDKSCRVVSRNGVNDRRNRACMNRVSSSFTQDNQDTNKLIYITHGWGYKNGGWLITLKERLLDKYGIGQTVVGVVYWTRGSRVCTSGLCSIFAESRNSMTFERNSFILSQNTVCCTQSVVAGAYGVAAANTWPIGNILAYVNEKIVPSRESNLFKTFCIGHSLGSHLCGFFGKMSKQLNKATTINKIIALDPAGPIWDYNDYHLQQDPNLRLNREDAEEVEVLHSNFKGLGFNYPLGSLDFYINGGNYQPGCENSLTEITAHYCSHLFVQKIFIALNNKYGYRCKATWKCDIRDGRQLVDIENEITSELRAKRCSKGPAVKMGKLDTSNERSEGVYWIDVDENSETCPFVSEE